MVLGLLQLSRTRIHVNLYRPVPRVYSHSLHVLSYGECQDKGMPLIVSEGNFTSTSDIQLDADHKSRIAQANQSIEIDARYMSARVDITGFQEWEGYREAW
jgi:hypothetical protein